MLPCVFVQLSVRVQAASACYPTDPDIYSFYATWISLSQLFDTKKCAIQYYIYLLLFHNQAIQNGHTSKLIDQGKPTHRIFMLKPRQTNFQHLDVTMLFWMKISCLAKFVACKVNQKTWADLRNGFECNTTSSFENRKTWKIVVHSLACYWQLCMRSASIVQTYPTMLTTPGRCNLDFVSSVDVSCSNWNYDLWELNLCIHFSVYCSLTQWRLQGIMHWQSYVQYLIQKLLYHNVVSRLSEIKSSVLQDGAVHYKNNNV